MLSRIPILVLCVLISFLAHAQPSEKYATLPAGNNILYQITTVRAAPGQLQFLLEAYQALAAGDYYSNAGLNPPFIIRHSQGDHWDLMLVSPLISFSNYYAPEHVRKRHIAQDQHANHSNAINDIIAFNEDHFMHGPPLTVLTKEFLNNTFAHIEIFHAIAGKKAELIHQRIIENQYLEGVERKANQIFVTQTGGDADVMTIGFYPSLQIFAAPQTIAPKQRDKVAKQVGFKGLDDISYYLRSLISSHHDSLANIVTFTLAETNTTGQ